MSYRWLSRVRARPKERDSRDVELSLRGRALTKGLWYVDGCPHRHEGASSPLYTGKPVRKAKQRAHAEPATDSICPAGEHSPSTRVRGAG